MIYKFTEFNAGMIMEIEHISNTLPENDTINFSIHEDGTDEKLMINLTKKEVFKLIGALHLLHKEMK
jgi:hypothetical protein